MTSDVVPLLDLRKRRIFFLTDLRRGGAPGGKGQPEGGVLGLVISPLRAAHSGGLTALWMTWGVYSSSRRLTSSAPSLTSSASTASSTCWTFVAPRMGAVTQGLLKCQARATCAGFTPFSRATSSTLSSTSKSLS